MLVSRRKFSTIHRQTTMQNPYGQFGYPTFTAPFYQQQPAFQQPMFQQQQLSAWPSMGCPGQQSMPQYQQSYRKCSGAAGGKSTRPAASRYRQKQRERRARRAVPVTRPLMRRESSKKNLLVEDLSEGTCLSVRCTGNSLTS